MKASAITLLMFLFVSCKEKESKPAKYEGTGTFILIHDTVYIHDTIYIGDAGIK